MATNRERAFLDALAALGLVDRRHFDEFLAARAQAEASLGHQEPVEHIVQARLTPEQVAQVWQATRRRILLCAHCWARMNAYGLPAGRHLACGSCRKGLVVPEDPFAEVMAAETEPAPAAASPADAPTASLIPPAADSATVIAHRAGSMSLAPVATGESAGFEGHCRALASHGLEVLAPVGRGGMGIVYRALQHPLRRTVAVKILRVEMGGDPILVHRFFREARTQAQVAHPNVGALHHAGRAADFYYLVLQWIPGKTLRSLVDSEGAMPAPRALPVAIDAARGLAAIHAAGLVHRDVTPANIMVREDGSACVIDFGLVRRMAPEKASLITRTGEMVGTFWYASPEQFGDSRTVGPASDVYSLGATLYHALAGMPPFAEVQNWVEIAARFSRGAVPRLDGKALGLPVEVVDLVARMMAADAGARFAGMAEAIPALQAALHRALAGPSARRPDETQELPAVGE